ncbi:MAG: hypothetical protein AAFX03_06285 [Pseudomonadota bacterium]
MKPVHGPPAESLAGGGKVTVIESGVQTIEQTGYERPGEGEFGKKASAALKAMLLAGAILAYPAAVVGSHTINDTPLPEAAFTNGWASLDSYVANRMILNEVNGAGWAADRAVWRPEARLTALPAWQQGVAGSLSDHFMTKAGFAKVGDEPDPDLSAAARLLRDTARMDMTPRLQAAAEALSRYNGRLQNGAAAQANGAAALREQLKLSAQWAATSKAELSALVGDDEGWPAGRASVEAYYIAKARAHVAAELLAAAGRENRALLDDEALQSAHDRALAHWRRAGDQAPVFVFNQAGDSLFGGNHLAAMAFMIDAAEASTLAYSDLLGVAIKKSAADANDLAMLQPSP